MREAILILLVIGLSIAGMAKARVALLAYIWFAVMRPDVLAWATDRPYSMLLGVVAILSCLRELPYAMQAIRNGWMILFALLMGWFGFSVVVSEHLSETLLMFRIFLPTMLTALLVPVVLRTFDDVRQLYLVMAFSLGVLGVKFGLWGVILGGVQITAGYGGSLTDNNLFALAMVVALPLCWYARDAVEDWRLRLLFLAFCVFIIPATVMTHSRGGALAMGAAVLFIVWQSRRRVLALTLLAVLLAPSVWLVKDSFVQRMQTLQNYEEDMSASGRLEFWKAAFRLSLDYPIAGVGFGGLSYTYKIGKYLPPGMPALYAHNNYLQMAADSGYPSLIIFCILLFGQMIRFWWAGLKFKNKDPLMYAMVMGTSGSLFGFAVGSIFLSRTHWETVYYILAMGAAFSPVIKERLQALEALPAPLVAEPPPPSPVSVPERLPEPSRYKLGGRLRQAPRSGSPAWSGRPRP